MTAVIGGCGDLGTEIGLRLAGLGRRVVGVRRRAEVLPPPIEPMSADLSRPLPPLPADTEVLVHTAAAGARDADTYRAVYLDGLHHLLDAAEAGGAAPRRVLFVSSTAVYDVDDGSDVDEDTPATPTSPTGRVLVEAEQALHARRPDAVVLRLAGVYGPGRLRLVDTLRAGTAVAPDPPVLTNRIHRDDAAAAVVHLLTADAPPAPCYVGVDDEPAPLGEVLDFLAARLDVPAPARGADVRSRGGHKRCRNDRLRATGFRFAYPSYREGYAAVLAGDGRRHR